MLKKLLFVFTALVLALSANAQVHQRRVLVEEFTGASCGPCASQNPGFNAILKANAGIVTAIKYQVNIPSYDPMYEQNPSEVNTRRTYYNVNSAPNGRVNGSIITNDCNGYDGAPACLSGAEIVTASNKLTPVTMSVSHSISATYDTVLVQVSVTSDSVLTGTLRLRVAVTEEEIFFDESPGSNGETEFFQVMRKMLPNAAGTATGDFTAGETKTYTFAWKIGYAYDLNQIAASAWLQNDDATKAVWQSAHSLPVGGVPAADIKIKTSNVFACQPGLSPSFTLTNTSDSVLTTADLRWRVGTAPWNDYVWTGTLASGASELVTLTDTVLTQAGSIKVEIEVLGSNNGIQTNLIDAVSTFNIKTLFDPASALPFGNPFQTTPFPPVGWTVANVVTSTATHGWKLATNAGANSTRSARCNFYDIGEGGKAYLTTPKVDLSLAVGATTLTFDHAYAYYNAALFDSLRVEVSANCGDTWTTIFHDGYEGLATAAPITTAFKPTADEWLPNTLDISAFNGTPELLIRFVGESGFGNNLFVDNLNVSTPVGVKELTLTAFSLQPNPTRDVSQVRFGLEKPQSIQLSVFNAMGVLVQSRNLGDLTSGDHAVSLEAYNLPSGSYRVVLQGKEGVANAQWVIVR